MNKKQLRMLANEIPQKRKQSMSKEALRGHLESMVPTEKPLVSRRDPLLNEIVARGTLVNADSGGSGIAERIIIGNKTFHERTATIDWLVARARE